MALFLIFGSLFLLGCLAGCSIKIYSYKKNQKQDLEQLDQLSLNECSESLKQVPVLEAKKNREVSGYLPEANHNNQEEKKRR